MSALTETITRLLNLANASPNTPIHTVLGHGMHIWITFNGKDKYRLSIGRQKTLPSFTEWNTTCAHWPYNIGKIPTPARSQDEHGINHFLTAILPAATQD